MLTKVLDILGLQRKATSGVERPEQWLKDVWGVEQTAAGVEVSAEGSMASSAVCACVRLLSESIASLPLFVYRRTGDDKVKAGEHPLFWLLHDRPNDLQTSFEWRQQLVSHVLLWGNAYSLIERDSAGRVGALWPLMPNRVTVRTDQGELSYEYWNRAEKRRYRREQVLHVKGPSIDGLTGISVVSMARQGIALSVAMERHGASLFRNAARPALAFKVAQVLTPVQRDQVKAALASYEGALNVGKSIVLEAGMEAQQLAFNAEDSQYLQSRQFSVQEIARWFRVSPAMIGDLSRSTYSNSEQEQLSFVVHSLRPHLVNLEQSFNSALLPERTQFFSEFSVEGLLRGDMAARTAAYERGFGKWLTANDIRRLENLTTIEGGDALTTARAGEVTL